MSCAIWSLIAFAVGFIGGIGAISLFFMALSKND